MSREILEAALDYARRGWAVFPISRDKTPLTAHGFKDATTDEAQIKKWFTHYTGANVAIATGEPSGGLVVVDIDIDEDIGKHGDETFSEWLEDNGAFIDTLTAVTGRGGKHLYFRSSKPYGNKVGAMPNIDIRGWGGYVVAPPSVHKNGRTYEWDCLADDIEDEIVNVQEDSDVQYFLDQCFRDTQPENKEPFKLPEVVQKGKRNDTIFKMASSMQSKGMDDEDIIRLCRGANNDFQPPLDDDELLRTIQQVLKYEKGNAKKQTKRETRQEEQKAKNIQSFQNLRRATELLAEDLPELNVLVGVGEEVPLLVEGTCILSAKSKLGKSWLSLELCDAVSKGKDFLGYKTKKCKTLYLDLETKKNLKQKRLRKLKKIVGELNDDFYIQDSAYMLGEGLEEELINYMQQEPSIGVVVIDVFQKVIKPKPRDVSEYEYYYEKIGALNKIAERFHISIILVCHDRKTVDPSDPFANILGSTALQGATDQMIVMFKAKYNDPITHISAKGRTIDGIVDINAQMNDGQWLLAENVSSVKKIDEFKKSPVLRGVLKMMSDGWTSWQGRCLDFKKECDKLGLDLELPLDKNGDEDLRIIGRMFNDDECKTINTVLEPYDLRVEVLNPEAKSGKMYKITRITVGTVAPSVDDGTGYEPPFEKPL